MSIIFILVLHFSWAIFSKSMFLIWLFMSVQYCTFLFERSACCPHSLCVLHFYCLAFTVIMVCWIIESGLPVGVNLKHCISFTPFSCSFFSLSFSVFIIFHWLMLRSCVCVFAPSIWASTCHLWNPVSYNVGKLSSLHCIVLTLPWKLPYETASLHCVEQLFIFSYICHIWMIIIGVRWFTSQRKEMKHYMKYII